MKVIDVYDEEDNFKNKIWVLTSYNRSIKKEDKIRKATSNEIAFKRKDQTALCPNSSFVSSRKSHLKQGRLNTCISSMSFSERKDMLKKSLEQHLVKDFSEM